MALKVLNPQGGFLAKVFQGGGFEAYLKCVREQFKVVKSRKPEASRSRSQEVYILAKSLK
jgi:23S rRNA (uridine2552-2'-O)-methyltransferase